MRVSPPYGSELFWHPADRNLMTQILAHERVKNLVDWIRDQQLEEAYQSVFRSSFLELREETAPEIHQLLRQACNLFGREELPGLYLTREPESTVELLGISRPIILLSDSFLRRLDQKALLGVLAGQVAGIQVGHHRGLTLAWLMETCRLRAPICRWRTRACPAKERHGLPPASARISTSCRPMPALKPVPRALTAASLAAKRPARRTAGGRPPVGASRASSAGLRILAA